MLDEGERPQQQLQVTQAKATSLKRRLKVECRKNKTNGRNNSKGEKRTKQVKKQTTSTNNRERGRMKQY